MTDLDTLKNQWAEAIHNLPWGAQRVFQDVLTLASEGKTPTPLVWGRDYGDGGACLVNQGAQFLSAISGEGGNGKPMRAFGEVVSLFDRINRELKARDVNFDNTVSPLAADILLQWFPTLKEPSLKDSVNEATAPEAFAEGVYREPSDEDLARDLMEFLTAPVESLTPEPEPQIESPVGNTNPTPFDA